MVYKAGLGYVACLSYLKSNLVKLKSNLAKRRLKKIEILPQLGLHIEQILEVGEKIGDMGWIWNGFYRYLDGRGGLANSRINGYLFRFVDPNKERLIGIINTGLKKVSVDVTQEKDYASAYKQYHNGTLQEFDIYLVPINKLIK